MENKPYIKYEKFRTIDGTKEDCLIEEPYLGSCETCCWSFDEEDKCKKDVGQPIVYLVFDWEREDKDTWNMLKFCFDASYSIENQFTSHCYNTKLYFPHKDKLVHKIKQRFIERGIEVWQAKTNNLGVK